MKTSGLFTPALIAGCVAGMALGCGAVVGAAQLEAPSSDAASAAVPAPAPQTQLRSTGLISEHAPPPAAGPCRLAQRPSQPLDTIRLFVATAVARRRPGLSYDLAAPSMRAGFSCAQWQTGSIPVVPMQAIDWSPGIPYRVVERTPGSVSLLLAIRSRLAVLGHHLFRITAERQSGHWYISYFMVSERMYAAPTFGSEH